MLEPLPEFKLEYRLYYDKNTGDPLFFSMTDEPGEYIIVTKEDYEEAAINYIQVVDNKLVRKKLDSELTNRYVPADNTDFAVTEITNSSTKTIKNDIQFVVDDTYNGEVSIWKLDD